MAIVSPSWGGPAAYPAIYQRGLQNLKALFGLEICEYPCARMPAAQLHAQPQKRAEDMNAAFQDPQIDAIFASIGGDDSVRILPYLDTKLILQNPKILMGYSDTVTLLAYLNSLGLVTFHGPAVMSGWAQVHNFDFLRRHYQQALFANVPETELSPFPLWANGYPDWGDPNQIGKVNSLQNNCEGWVWLQGQTPCRGQLWGGCLEVIDFLKATPYWPQPDFWAGKILFFETSEEKPLPHQVGYSLRNLGMQGILSQISGLLFGRPKDYSHTEKQALYATIKRVVAEEFDLPEMPIVANLDFGHTEPNCILPYGLELEMEPIQKRLRICEPFFAGEIEP